MTGAQDWELEGMWGLHSTNSDQGDEEGLVSPPALS